MIYIIVKYVIITDQKIIQENVRIMYKKKKLRKINIYKFSYQFQ